MRKHKVLMIVENNSFPQDSRVRHESRVLTSNGYQVTVIAPVKAGQRWSEVIEGVRVYRYPLPPQSSGMLSYIVEFGYSLIAAFVISIIVLLRHGFQVIHAHNPPDILVLIAMFYKLIGKKFVFDHHDLAPEMYQVLFPDSDRKSLFRALLFFEKLSCKVADRVIETNQSYKEIDMSRNGVPEEKIFIVRNGPTLNRSEYTEAAPGLHREGKVAIGYAGEIGHHDGLDYLVRALHTLLFDLGRSDFVCFVFGDGDALNDTKQLANKLELDDYIVFTGWLDHEQVLPSLSAMDICVAPEPANSYNDRSTMIKIMEYMSVARPIVAFDLREHHNSAQDAAVYAQNNDPSMFAAEIMKLMDDASLREELGKKGRLRIEKHLAWEHQAQQLVTLYGELLKT